MRIMWIKGKRVLAFMLALSMVMTLLPADAVYATETQEVEIVQDTQEIPSTEDVQGTESVQSSESTQEIEDTETEPVTEIVLEETEQVEQLTTTGAASGSFNENMHWSYADGTLTVSGSGMLTNATECSDAISAYFDVVETLIFADDVVNVNHFCYSSFTALKTIHFGKSVTNAYVSGLSAESTVATITVDEENEKYAAIDGVLYSKDLETIYRYPAMCESYQTVSGYTENEVSCVYEINENVTKIPSGAFRNTQNLNGVIIPYDVTTIDIGAFRDWKNTTLYVFYRGPQSRWNEAIKEAREGYDNVFSSLLSSIYTITEVMDYGYDEDDSYPDARDMEYFYSGISVKVNSAVYTGSAVEPKVRIVTHSTHSNICGGLTEGTDYIVAYSDNTEVGTATAEIKFIRAYTGSYSVNFQVMEAAAMVYDTDKEAFLIQNAEQLQLFAQLASGAVDVSTVALVDQNGATYTGSYDLNATVTQNIALGANSLIFEGNDESVPTINLDFGGYELVSANKDIIFVDNADVTVSNAKIQSTYVNAYGVPEELIYIPAGRLSLDNVELVLEGAASGADAAIVADGGTVIANNVTIETNQENYALIANAGSSVTIAGDSVFTSGIYAEKAAITVNGGRITSEKAAIWNKNGTTVINGGLLGGYTHTGGSSSDIPGVYIQGGTIEVNGGLIEGNNAGLFAKSATSVVITGGIIISDGYYIPKNGDTENRASIGLALCGCTGTVEITGGFFRGMPADENEETYGIYCYDSRDTSTGIFTTGSSTKTITSLLGEGASYSAAPADYYIDGPVTIGSQEYTVNHYGMGVDGNYQSTPIYTETIKATLDSDVDYINYVRPELVMDIIYGMFGSAHPYDNDVYEYAYGESTENVINIYYARKQFTADVYADSGIEAITIQGKEYENPKDGAPIEVTLYAVEDSLNADWYETAVGALTEVEVTYKAGFGLEDYTILTDVEGYEEVSYDVEPVQIPTQCKSGLYIASCVTDEIPEVIEPIVSVTGPDNEIKAFSSFKKAIDCLDEVAEGEKGTYTFTFTENGSLAADLTIPVYAESIIFTTENDFVEIDFKGYTLTSAGDISVESGVYFVNSAGANGKLVSTKKTDITDYAIGIWEEIEGINLSAVNGTLMLVGDESTKTISGDVTAKDIIVYDTWEVEGKVTNSGIHNVGTFICDTFTQKSTNQTNLEKDSIFVIKTKADIYNVTRVFGEDGKNPAIYQMADATVSINGKVDYANGQISYGVLAENDAEVDGLYDTFTDLKAQQLLFTTNIKTFPVEGIQLMQASAEPRYTTLLQKGTQMVVAGEWIVVKTRGVDGKKESEVVLKKFTTWKDASAYIATLSNSTMTYVVEITDNLVMDETLTMPAKAAGIIFRGAGFEENGKVTVTYENTLKLVTDTTFENITLENVKTVSGKNLSLVDAELTISGAVALTGTLFMENATLDSDSKINVANVISNSAGNRILYGGNTSKDILTITGTVTAGPDLESYGAIDVTVKAIADSAAGYTDGAILMNAAKASATWFTADGAETHKSGKVIKYGSVEGTVALQLRDDSIGEYIDLGEFVTFQQAVDEINQLADAKAEYRIVLLENTGDATKVITTPAKAAHVTISGGDSVKTLAYKNAITLKSDVTLENIVLAPAVASNSIAGNKFALELVNSDIYVGGAVSNVGTLTLSNATLTAEGDITVTDVVNPIGTAKIVTTAVLTRKNGVITKVAPKLTINGTATIWGEGIEVVLREKTTTGYVVIDFNAAEAANICASGIPFAKAANLSSDSLVLSEEHFAEGTTIIVTKSAGYLAGLVGDAGATLSYEDEAGNLIVSRMLHFADAVTEINNLKTKRDYTITLYGTYTAPKALAMPNKNYVSTLTIEGTGEYVELYHNGNITLTSPTILSNVYFKKTDATENAPAITFQAGGYALTVAGKVYFNTPVNFNGGKKGTLEVTDAGQLYTITNGKDVPSDVKENLVCGGITNFAEVIVKAEQILRISSYETTKKIAGTLNVTTLTNAGSVLVVGNAAGSVKITDVYLNDGRLESNGTMNIVNMTLEGIGDVVVKADAAFNITGKLVSKTDKAVFYTRQNVKNVPYLSINGTVTLENQDNRIRVGVYSADGTQLVKLQATAQLLTAKTATADMFIPMAGNVGVEAYPAEGGYFLQKSGTAIYVYYADEVAVAVCAGNVDTGNLEDAEVLGYYATFKDAVAAIDALKDKTAEYTMVLLEDVNTVTAPTAVTLPTQAANVIITSRDGEVYDIYYTGNISLKAPTEFVKIRFNPMNTKKQGVASNIAAGNYDLTLRDVEVGDTSGMKINNITGSAKQVTTLATDRLVIYGGVTNSKELVIEKSLIVNGAVKATIITMENGTSDKTNVLTANGAFTTDNLVMQGFATVDAADALTINNIFNETTANIGEGQINTICYGKNSKGAPNLTVKGVVSGKNAEKVVFNYDVSGATVADYTLLMQSNKYTLSDKQKLATVEKAALSEITFQLAGVDLGEQETVKANKGVYIVGENANGALLQSSSASGVTTSYCLDYSQAVNEINNIADKTVDYTIIVGITGANVTDTNLTDANAVSAITMPKKNTAATLTVAADTKVSMNYTGNISYPGALTFENISLIPKGDCSITGTKNVSTVTLVDADATFKNISNVNVMTLDGADLVTTGTVTVIEVILRGVSQWHALAKTTVTNVDASQMKAESYIASKQDAKTLVPIFTISGEVTVDAAGTPVAWKVLAPVATAGSLTEVAQYKNTSLVVAPKEDADKFVAWPFSTVNIANNAEGMTAENLTSYKTIKNEVVNGDRSEMVVRIVQTHEGKAGQAVTYAKSFDEAVTIINNIGDMTASYRMELLQGDLFNPVKTTLNGTAYGKLTLPTKAADVTIVGANEDDVVVMLYTGTLAVNCDTTFDNIALSEGTLKNGEFVNTHMITPSYKGAYELTFTDSVQTLWKQADGAPLADIVLASASIAKGTLTLDGVDVYVAGALTVNDLKITGTNYLTTAGKTTITNILDGDTASDVEHLKLAQYFTKTTNATQKSVTQLAMNGEIEDVDVSLASYIYDFEKGYHGVTATEISNQKLATMPKASIEDVILLVDTDTTNSGQNFMAVEEGGLYKQNTGLYYTTEPLVVKVVGTDTEGNEIYESDFLTWDEAVKEIDKRANNTMEYQMILLENIDEPIKTLTLPSKAGEVTVTSEAGEENYVLFTANKITLKCNTNFENVGLYAVTQPKNSTAYSSIAYTIASGNYALGLADMQSEVDGYYSMPSTISGGAKGTLTVVFGSEASNSLFVVDKISGFGTVNVYNEAKDDAIVPNQVESVGIVTTGMSGIGTLNVYPGAILISASGTVTTKNANICGGAVMAKDITVSQVATLESAILMAGSEAANDGKLKLKDIVVEDTYNYLSAEQDKNGKTQMSITGNVTASEYYIGTEGDSAIVVDLYYNNYSAHTKLSEGLVLINATKADAGWFVPAYTTYDADEDETMEGMGYETAGYGLYNTKKEIVYGALVAEN